MFQLYTIDTAFCFFYTAFSLHILWGNLDVLQYDGHTLDMYGVEMIWYHFSSVFSLCFFTMDFAGNDMLSHCCFPFLPSSSSSMLHCMPIFIDLISCFSHPGLHSEKLVVLRVFTFQAAQCFICINFNLLLQLTHSIHINFIFSSFSSCIHIFFYIFLVLNLWYSGFSPMCHSFIYINLSLFFLQGSWNNTRVILLPIFTSSLSILRLDWISFFVTFSTF